MSTHNIADRIAYDFKQALDTLGFSFFEKGDYNLNLIGVRSNRSESGYFDDVLACLYKVRGIWRAHMWAITTDPGTNLLKNPMNASGCAILAAPQQMRGAYIVGKHKGRDALVQHGAEVKIWRDNDRDTILNWGLGVLGDTSGWYGINIHDTTSSDIADTNKGSSAGCQVFCSRKEHAALMDLVNRSASHYGPKFTYTLIRTEDM